VRKRCDASRFSAGVWAARQFWRREERSGVHHGECLWRFALGASKTAVDVRWKISCSIATELSMSWAEASGGGGEVGGKDRAQNFSN